MIEFKTLRKSQLPALHELVDVLLKEKNLFGQSNSEHVINCLNSLYDIRSCGVYVDDTQDPKHLVILTHLPDMLSTDLVCHIFTCSSHPDHRSDIKTTLKMYEIAENYAKMTGCSHIVAESWVDGDGPNITPILERMGFVAKTKKFIKLLT